MYGFDYKYFSGLPPDPGVTKHPSGVHRRLFPAIQLSIIRILLNYG
jgi:hypothetical protein